jgi:hypothetical protein
MNDKKDRYTLFGYAIQSDKATKVIDETIQTTVGITAGVYYTATGKPFRDPPEDGKFIQENRQDFADRLKELEKRPETQLSIEGQRQIELLNSQNNTQESAKQPVPKGAVDQFVESVSSHIDLDVGSIEKTGEAASYIDHRKLSLENHKKEAKAFEEAFNYSGEIVHKTIAPAKENMALRFFETEGNENPDSQANYGLNPFC